MRLHVPQPLSALDEPLSIQWCDDELVVIGLGAVAFSMTRAAAAETLTRLIAVMAASVEAPPPDIDRNSSLTSPGI